jgi:integrase
MAKKVRVWFREQRNAWYGEYWEGPRRKAKCFGPGKEGEKLARRWQSYMLHKLNYEDWQGVKSLPWEEFTEQYIEHKKASGISPAQIAEISGALRRFASLVGMPRSDKLATRHITMFKAKRPGLYEIKPTSKRGIKDAEKKHKKAEEAGIVIEPRKVSPRTINKDLEAIRALINWGIENHYCANNIKIDMLPTVTRKFQPPSAEQLSDLFSRAKTCPPLYLRMVLAVALGVRRTALERISIVTADEYHIDLSTGIVKTLDKRKYEVIHTLGPTVLALVNNYVAQHLPDGSRLLFPEPWDGRIRNVWEDIRTKAGLPRFTFHNLRNVSASLLADQGESGSVIQDHLGHRNITTTQRYIGVGDEAKGRVARKLDEALKGLL